MSEADTQPPAGQAQDDGPAAAESLLFELLGTKFLEYVLNASERDVRGHFEGSSLDPQRSAALSELALVLAAVVPDPSADPFLRRWSLQVLGQRTGETSYANTLRQRCGGETAAWSTGNAVDDLVTGIARDLYPLWLLPAVEGPLSMASPFLGSLVYQHPDQAAIETAVMADADLSRLFPVDRPGQGRMGQYTSSMGRGGGVQLALFADHMMRSAWPRAELLNRPPSLDEFLASVRETLDLIRDAAAGRPATVRVMVGLAGLKLPGDASVSLPWGKLRPASDDDRRALPSEIPGSLGTTTPEGQQVTIDYAGDVVMEMELPYRIQIGERDIISQGWPDDLKDYELIQRRLEAVQLALLLSLQAEPQPMVVPAWTQTFDPLSYGPQMGWNDTRRTSRLAPTQLTVRQRNEWVRWIADVDAHRVPSIEIAIRRTIRAATERADPTDALVDAVIAWENLVGSQEGEVTLRASAALAWLLSRTVAQRRTRQSQIKALYRVRSQIVHGNKALDHQEAWEKAREAQAISIEALQVLFRDRPELLHDANDGTERSLRLILGEGR